MININLKEIFPVDNQSDLSAKLNFNFNQLLALGFGERGETGPAGEIGPIGPIGPIGVAGDPGSQIFSVIGEPGSPPANPSEAVIGDYFISDTGIFKKSTASEWNLISNFTDIFTDIASASLLSWQLGVKDPNSLSKILVPINNSAGIDRGNGVPGVSVDFSTNDPNWYNDDDAKSNSQVTIFNFDPQTTKTYEANSGQNGYGVTIQTNRIGDAVDDSVFPYTALLSLYSFYNISDSSTEALQFDNITGYRHQLELGSVDDAVEELVTDNPDAQYVISPTWQNLRIRKYRRTSSQPGGLIINADFMEKLMNLQKHLRNFETVIPNRLEFFNGKPFCVDIFALPGWKSESKFIDNQTFVEPINTHSGFMFLPRKTFLRAYKNRKHVHPTILIGDYMASSLANIFSSMRVYRPIPTNSSLTIVHEDSWSSRMLEKDMFSLSDLSLFIESNSFVEIELVNSLNNHNAEF